MWLFTNPKDRKDDESFQGTFGTTKTFECSECRHIVAGNPSKTVKTIGWVSSSDRVYCKLCVPPYDNIHTSKQYEYRYYKEVECDVFGKVIVKKKKKSE